MMGLHSKQEELWCEPVNLARRIPENHPLRQLQQVLDLSFVHQEVSGCYGRNGNVSVDPVIVLKMMLLLFWDNVSSERELMRVIPLRIDYLWFLGYSLEDEVPNHSVLSKARKRWGGELFAKLFGRVVQQCFDAGLVDGSKLHADSSLIRANASLNSVVQITLAKLEEDDERSGESSGKKSAGGPVNRKYVAQTDPDARMVRHHAGKALPSYKNHRLVDDKKGVVTVSQTTHGVIDDGAHLPSLLAEHQARVSREVRTVVADARYGTNANFIALAQSGIESHLADLRRPNTITTRKASTRRRSLLMMRQAISINALRGSSYTGTTSTTSAATMNTGPKAESARPVLCRNNAPGRKPGEASTVTRSRSYWTRRESNRTARQRS